VGTQKLEKMTAAQYPQARVARLDTDAVSKRDSSEKILKDFADHKTDILIGTQMVVKGHDYHNVTLVGIMAADTSLYASQYDSAERTFELIDQAAGRAGRGAKPGCVIIQTYKPEHYAIECASRDDYRGYFDKEIAYRKLLNYPPATHIWTAQLSSRDSELLEKVANEYAETIKRYSKGVNAEFVGPVEPTIAKINDYYRKLTFFKHSNYDILLSAKENADRMLRERFPDIMISVLHDFT